MPRRWLNGILIVLVVPVVVSCAETKGRAPSRVNTTPPPAAQEAPPPSRRAVDQAQYHMQGGGYQKAIDVYADAYQKAPHDQALLDAYIESIAYMAGAADQALERQDLGAAGKRYDVLLKNYTRFKGFEKKLTFTRIGLEEKLAHCKKTLFKQGFQEYRQGNLSQSIALWEDLLAIDPQNTDIKKALRTAKLQQKNLREQEE